jgi:nucleoside-diphosphate-sugar epimerase
MPDSGWDLPEPLSDPFDAVIHLAGNADHGLATRSPWLDLQATGVSGAAVLGQIRTRQVVLLSSAAVYAGLSGLVNPDDCLEPPMAYALSKRYMEGFVSTLEQSGRIAGATIVRLYNAFGSGERPTRLIPRVANAVRDGGPFVLTGDPTSLSDPVAVEDVVRVLYAGAALQVSGTFDLCGGDPRPLSEQVGRIAAALGYPSPPIQVELDPDQVPIRFWSDARPILEALQLDGLQPFDAAVRRYGTAERWFA